MTDYDELAVDTEGSASATFSYQPDYVVPLAINVQTIEKEFELGYKQTFPAFTNARRSWQLSFNALGLTDRDAIVEFVQARIGSVEAFNWTPPDEADPVKVCAISDSIKSEKVGSGVYYLSVVLMELY